MIIVGIITAPRTPMYIGQSLDSFFYNTRHMETQVHVFAEPNTPHFKNESRVIRHDNVEKHGILFNWLWMAQWLVRNTKSEYLLLCEDDVLWKEKFNLRTEEAVSYWTSAVNKPKTKMGWDKGFIGATGWCGSLAFSFKREYLIKMLNHVFMQPSVPVNHLDTIIGATIEACGSPVLCRVPSVVSHLGVRHSSIIPNNSPHLDAVCRKECCHE